MKSMLTTLNRNGMYARIKNHLHLHVLMRSYIIRNWFTGNGAIWRYLDSADLERMVARTVDFTSLDLSGKNVLDLGCGSGTMLAYLAKKEGVVPHGVDISRLNIRECRKKMGQGNFHRMDIMQYLSAPPLEQFDLVIMYGVSAGFTVERQKEIIWRIIPILRPDGYLWVGANIYDDAKYKYQTYPVPRNFYEQLKSRHGDQVDFEEHLELELFGNDKYEKEQTTVLIRKL